MSHTLIDASVFTCFFFLIILLMLFVVNNNMKGKVWHSLFAMHLIAMFVLQLYYVFIVA